jgi:hypothetical protein
MHADLLHHLSRTITFERVIRPSMYDNAHARNFLMACILGFLT